MPRAAKVLQIPYRQGINTLTFAPTGPSALGTAPITSASPPVLINGTHSDATNRTLTSALQIVYHRLGDQAGAVLGPPEPLGVQIGILADHQSLSE